MSGNGPRRYRPGRLFHREVVEAANLSLALSRTIVPRLKRFGVLAVSPRLSGRVMAEHLLTSSAAKDLPRQLVGFQDAPRVHRRQL